MAHATSTGTGCSPGGCGGGDAPPLPPDIRARVHDHPCYSEQAHRHYARMHVPVAPACNLQCHYCNRKYDCSNESRPGVTSALLTPRQAVRRVRAVADRVPELSVVGIAGPGDPLANPGRTLATLAGVRDAVPRVRLCVSTNGLALPEHVDALCALGVDHVTVTINCVDPEVGAAMHPWVFWRHRRLRGRKAARVLLEQQQRGLAMLVERGVLVKVNSVLVPGVNAGHLPEVSRVVRHAGAFLHNVMPLIADPAHGTYYGVMGQRGPTDGELQDVQSACGADMRIMRHCRQCRADAVGRLGEDRSGEVGEWEHALPGDPPADPRDDHSPPSPAIPMQDGAPRSVRVAAPELPARGAWLRIAVASSDGARVDSDLDAADHVSVYTVGARGARLAGHRAVPAGAGPGRLEGLAEALRDCDGVLAARVGIGLWRQLEAMGVRPCGEHGGTPVAAALAAMRAEILAAGGAAAAGLEASA